DKVYEDGLRVLHRALQLRVVLHTDEEWMRRKFYDLNQTSSGVLTTRNHSCCFECREVIIVEFPAMTMALAYCSVLINGICERILLHFAGISSETHGAGFGSDLLLLFHQVNHRFLAIGIHFRRVRFFQTEDISCKLDNRHLHSKTNSEEG